VSAGDPGSVLQAFHREKHALLGRHEAGARLVAGYEYNNAYQYVIAREQTHLEWLRSAIAELSQDADETGAALDVPAVGKGASGALALFEDDARRLRAFVEGWRSRLDEVGNARHRKMLEVILGESAEHARMFEQAAAGRTDLLGRRMPNAGTGDGVLPVRWIN
jgi:hypothetical protein